MEMSPRIEFIRGLLIVLGITVAFQAFVLAAYFVAHAVW
jgi:hypothetical protein